LDFRGSCERWQKGVENGNNKNSGKR
jgi:hypothetical protein